LCPFIFAFIGASAPVGATSPHSISTWADRLAIYAKVVGPIFQQNSGYLSDKRRQARPPYPADRLDLNFIDRLERSELVGQPSWLRPMRVAGGLEVAPRAPNLLGPSSKKWRGD